MNLKKLKCPKCGALVFAGVEDHAIAGMSGSPSAKRRGGSRYYSNLRKKGIEKAKAAKEAAMASAAAK